MVDSKVSESRSGLGMRELVVAMLAQCPTVERACDRDDGLGPCRR